MLKREIMLARLKEKPMTISELAESMDAMPVKTLAAESLVNADGAFCTLGVLGQARGMEMAVIDPEDWDEVAKAFNLAPAMVREIVFENDEATSTYEWVDVVICGPMPPYHYQPYGHKQHNRSVRVPIDPALVAKKRWQHMRNWVANHLKTVQQAGEAA